MGNTAPRKQLRNKSANYKTSCNNRDCKKINKNEKYKMSFKG